jgi:ketosteroid isomerase-like protein
MQRPLVFHALILSLVGAGACRPAEQPQTESTAAPAQSLHEAFDQTAEVWNRGDIAAIGTGLADDMTQLQPGLVFVGKESLMARWTEFLNANNDVWTPTVRNAVENGSMGYVTFSFTETSTPKAGGDPSTMEGLGLAVFRRDANGAWKQTLDSWYTPPITALTSLPGRGPLTPEAEAVKAVFDQYVKDWNVPDMDAVEALLDPEVVQLVQSTPDTTFVGRDALMASWRKLVSENTDVWSPTVLDVQVSGDLAYLMYSGEETITPKAGGPAQNLVGSGWEVFRRDATGSWKLVNESFFSRAK